MGSEREREDTWKHTNKSRGTIHKGFTKTGQTRPAIPASRERVHSAPTSSYTLEAQTDSPSLSKRGTGNFASQAQRFPKIPPIVYKQPGPGQYHNPNRNEQPKGVGYKAPVSTDSTPFVTPGPGDYNTSDAAPKNSKGSSAFLDNTGRIEQHIANVPGPGKYNVKLRGQASHITSSFISTSKRSDNWPQQESPGPGYYDTPSDITAKKDLKPNASFISNDKALTPTSITPGPGSYLSIEEYSTPSHPSPVAPPYLKYRTKKQHSKPTTAEPVIGPGSYYTETSLVKPSFHCNRTDEWSV